MKINLNRFIDNVSKSRLKNGEEWKVIFPSTIEEQLILDYMYNNLKSKDTKR